MTFNIETYLDALREGALDTYLNAAGVLCDGFYTASEKSKLDADELADLMMLTLYHSSLSEADLIHFQAMEWIAQSEPLFQSGEVGAKYMMMCMATLAALSIKKAGLEIPPHRDKTEFKKIIENESYKEAILKATEEHSHTYYQLLSNPNNKQEYKKTVRQLSLKISQYEKEVALCDMLKDRLKSYLTLLTGQDLSEDWVIQRQDMVKSFYEVLKPLTFLSPEYRQTLKSFLILLAQRDASDTAHTALHLSEVLLVACNDTLLCKEVMSGVNTLTYQLMTQLSDYADYLTQHADFLLSKKKKSPVITRWGLVDAFLQAIQGYSVITENRKEILQAYTLVLKKHIEKIKNRTKRKEEESRMSILYDIRYLNAITPHCIPIISDKVSIKRLPEREEVLDPTIKKGKETRQDKMVELEDVATIRRGESVLSIKRVIHMRTSFWYPHPPRQRMLMEPPVSEAVDIMEAHSL